MTKKDLINYLETDDFVYINANGVYIGIFSNRELITWLLIHILPLILIQIIRQLIQENSIKISRIYGIISM